MRRFFRRLLPRQSIRHRARAPARSQPYTTVREHHDATELLQPAGSHIDADLQGLVAMGFDHQMAQDALTYSHDIGEAIEALLRNAQGHGAPPSVNRPAPPPPAPDDPPTAPGPAVLMSEIERLRRDNSALRSQITQSDSSVHGSKSDGSAMTPKMDCVCCLTRQVNTVFLPCGHVCTCAECADRVCSGGHGQCPLCRRRITTKHRVFLALPSAPRPAVPPPSSVESSMGGTTARIECTDSSTQTDRFVSDDAVVALRDVGEEQRAASTSPTRSLRHVGNGNGKAVLPTATSTCAEFRRRWRVFSTSSNSSEDDTTTNTSSRGRSMPGDSLTLINRTGSLGGGMNPWGDPTGTAAACAASGARGNSPWGDYRSAPLFSGRWRESADGRWERVYYASDDRTTSAGPSSSYSSSSSMSRREMAMRLSSYCCSGSSRTTSIGQLMTAHL